MQFSTLSAITSLLALSTATPIAHWSFPGFSGLVPKNKPTPRPEQCDLSKSQMPACAPPLTTPAAESYLAAVVIGHGTQNYTCADSTAASIPAGAGAVATLFNASCIASSVPKMLPMITAASLNVPAKQLGVLPNIGKHYFSDGTTPVFDIPATMGKTSLKKGGSSPAPKNDNGNVPWLYLQSKPEGTNSKVVAVYRVNTAGGSAPATCEGMGATFEVPYSAEYWFYATK